MRDNLGTNLTNKATKNPKIKLQLNKQCCRIVTYVVEIARAHGRLMVMLRQCITLRQTPIHQARHCCICEFAAVRVYNIVSGNAQNQEIKSFTVSSALCNVLFNEMDETHAHCDPARLHKVNPCSSLVWPLLAAP